MSYNYYFRSQLKHATFLKHILPLVRFSNVPVEQAHRVQFFLGTQLSGTVFLRRDEILVMKRAIERLKSCLLEDAYSIVLMPFRTRDAAHHYKLKKKPGLHAGISLYTTKDPNLEGLQRVSVSSVFKSVSGLMRSRSAWFLVLKYEAKLMGVPHVLLAEYSMATEQDLKQNEDEDKTDTEEEETLTETKREQLILKPMRTRKRKVSSSSSAPGSYLTVLQANIAKYKTSLESKLEVDIAAVLAKHGVQIPKAGSVPLAARLSVALEIKRKRICSKLKKLTEELHPFLTGISVEDYLQL